jgi:hypothetical protein
MQLKPFEAGRYDDNFIVIRNPDNGKQELFSEEEFEIVKFLKKNENETLLALLLPNIGIAKKDHIVACLKVMGKLKRMQVIDNFAITGRKAVSDTATLEMESSGTKLEMLAGNTFVAFCFALGERVFSWLGSYGVLLLALGLASFSYLFFPFEQLEAAFQTVEFSYASVFVFMYLTACVALSLRAILQGAFLRAQGRSSARHRLRFFFPLVSFECDKREVNLLGHGARIRMGVLGLVAPLAFSSIFTGAFLLGWIGLPWAFFGFAACVWALLTTACPFFSGDVADIFHVLFLRDELKERISSSLRGIFGTKGSLSREMLFGLMVSFAWLLAWLDCFRGFWDVIAGMVGADFFLPMLNQRKIGAIFTVAFLLFMLAMPAVYFLGVFIKDRFGRNRRKIVVEKGKLKESLSFEERMAALEKIPLFAYLNDQERLSLLNEMHPAFYQHGDYLMHQGEVGNEFYVLVKGRANAYFTDMQGRVYLLADLAEGDAFGEIALIDEVPRTASIVSDGGCIVLVLNKQGFANFAKSLGSPDRVKTMIRLTSFFRRHPLFSRLGVRDQAQLIDTFRFETITAGEEVPKSQENFYVIYSGKVRVDTPEDGDDVFLTADDCFGYEDVMGARYIAQEGTGLLTVRRHEFQTLIWEKLVERPDLFI